MRGGLWGSMRRGVVRMDVEEGEEETREDPPGAPVAKVGGIDR